MYNLALSSVRIGLSLAGWTQDLIRYKQYLDNHGFPTHNTNLKAERKGRGEKKNKVKNERREVEGS